MGQNDWLQMLGCFWACAHPLGHRPESQCLLDPARGIAAQRITAFSTGL